jgi:hypothetical protein
MCQARSCTDGDDASQERGRSLLARVGRKSSGKQARVTRSGRDCEQGALAIPSERTGEDSEQNREPLFSRVCWNGVLGVFSFFTDRKWVYKGCWRCSQYSFPSIQFNQFSYPCQLKLPSVCIWRGAPKLPSPPLQW